VADLRARRLHAMRERLRARLAEGGFEGARTLVEELAQDFDVFDVAAAALMLMQEASVSDDQASARSSR
jgi:ATP-dependent RNA helicase DeaD